MNHKPVFVNFPKKISLKIEITLAHVILYSGTYLNNERPVKTRIQRDMRISVLYIVLCFFIFCKYILVALHTIKFEAQQSLKKLYEVMSV